MRVIAPWAGRIHPTTARLLNAHAPGHVRVRLPLADRGAYCDLLTRLWADGETFTIVEHDIGITARVLGTFAGCPELWCAFRYRVDRDVIAALGCTRFRAELLTAEPDLLAHVAQVDGDGLPAKDWRRLDVRLMDALHARGYTRHEHGTVAHYHRYG